MSRNQRECYMLHSTRAHARTARNDVQESNVLREGTEVGQTKRGSGITGTDSLAHKGPKLLTTRGPLRHSCTAWERWTRGERGGGVG